MLCFSLLASESHLNYTSHIPTPLELNHYHRVSITTLSIGFLSFFGEIRIVKHYKHTGIEIYVQQTFFSRSSFSTKCLNLRQLVHEVTVRSHRCSQERCPANNVVERFVDAPDVDNSLQGCVLWNSLKRWTPTIRLVAAKPCHSSPQ